jgi:V8-like Glu-specific endopeptidase
VASPGHFPVTNIDRVDVGRRVLETAGSTLTSKESLPYYRRHNGANAIRLIPESYVAEVPELATPLLTDVAVASFGNAIENTNTALLEAIIGDDDRVRVSKGRMAMNPWRQICALRIVSQSNRTYVGTGWFIAAGVLATAGHCVFLQNDRGWAKSILVIPGKHGTQEPFGAQTSLRFASVDGWVEKRQHDFDYGVIFLDDRTAGERVGNFGVEALSPAELKGTDAQISGYPADRDRAEFQFFHLRPMIDVTNTRLIYDIDTFGGQSGSPIWQETIENGLIAVGIHTTGGVSSNSGTRITDDVLENLVKWTTA